MGNCKLFLRSCLCLESANIAIFYMSKMLPNKMGFNFFCVHGLWNRKFKYIQYVIWHQIERGFWKMYAKMVSCSENVLNRRPFSKTSNLTTFENNQNWKVRSDFSFYDRIEFRSTKCSFSINKTGSACIIILK